MEQQLLANAQIHIRFEGRSIDIEQNTLDVGLLSTDAEVRQAVANHLGVPMAKMQSFAVDRNQATGSMTMRPEAVFGWPSDLCPRCGARWSMCYCICPRCGGVGSSGCRCG